MAVTVDSVRLQAKQRADMVNSNFVSPSEWIAMINLSWKELYDILVAKFEDYYTAPPLTFTVTAGNTAPLPLDFYKMRGLDYALSGSDFYPLEKFTFLERNNRSRGTLYQGLYPTVKYRIYGDEILFTPDDGATGSYRLWYIPRATDLTTETDTLDGVNGWEEYVIVDAAIKALQKEESDVSVLMAQKQALLLRINDMAQNRDAGSPEKVTDVTNAFNDDLGGW
jgi:hypothetical protein